MRINWQSLYDRGFTPLQIKKDKVAFPWYDEKKHKVAMYKAFRLWKEKKKTAIKSELAISVGSADLSEQKDDQDIPTPSTFDLNAALEEIVSKMTYEITKEQLSLKREAIEMARRLLRDMDSDPAMSPVLKVRLLEVLIDV